MTTGINKGPGAFRRMMKNLAAWSETLNYSGIDYTLDRLAFVEREVAAIKDWMSRFEASQNGPRATPPIPPAADQR